MKRSLAHVALTLILCAATDSAFSQVEWFTKEEPSESGYRWSSHIGTSVQAVGSTASGKKCTFDWVNGPEKLTGWWGNFVACDEPRKLVERRPGTFLANQTAVALGRHVRSKQEGKLEAIAKQDAKFDPTQMTLEAEVQARPSGASVGNRAKLAVWGTVYFRVNDAAGVRLTLLGKFGWSGKVTARNGRLRVTYMKNTLTGGRRDFEAIDVKFPIDDRKEPFAKTALLGPGAYVIEWLLSLDPTDSPAVDSSMRLDVKLVLGDWESCSDPPISRAPGWPKGLNRAAKVKVVFDGVGPFESKEICANETPPTVCWKARPVKFSIDEDGVPAESRAKTYVGYEFIPGTLRRHIGYGIRCQDLDPRFNCHGLSFAEGRYWLEEDQTSEFRRRCVYVGRELGHEEAGDVRIFVRSKPITLKGKTFRPYEQPSHSQIMLGTPAGAVDQKLGILRYGGELPNGVVLVQQTWITDDYTEPRVYRCFNP